MIINNLKPNMPRPNFGTRVVMSPEDQKALVQRTYKTIQNIQDSARCDSRPIGPDYLAGLNIFINRLTGNKADNHIVEISGFKNHKPEEDNKRSFDMKLYDQTGNLQLGTTWIVPDNEVCVDKEKFEKHVKGEFDNLIKKTKETETAMGEMVKHLKESVLPEIPKI